jgi:hypothetical protein
MWKDAAGVLQVGFLLSPQRGLCFLNTDDLQVFADRDGRVGCSGKVVIDKGRLCESRY